MSIKSESISIFMPVLMVVGACVFSGLIIWANVSFYQWLCS